MITTLYISNQRLDQFKEENVDVVSSVVDISDITKNTTDYTKSFTVPASRRNNIIFKHYYDANIDNSFDARTKVDGRIELDGIPFKIGKFRLQKVSVIKNKPSSYTINFFGNLVDLKKKARNYELKDLDLSAYDHDYDSANVLTGLTSSLFSGDMVYTPMVKKQYYYNSGTDNTQSPTLTNIAYDGGADTGIVWNDLRPSLRVINIIEAIEVKLGVEFSRDFFGTTEFNNLFLWLNNSEDKTAGGATQVVDFDGGGSTWMNLTTNVGTYTKPSSVNGTFRLKLTVTPDSGSASIEYTVTMYVNDESAGEVTGAGTLINEYDFFGSEPGDYTVYYTVTSTQEFTYSASLLQRRWFVGGSETTTASANTIESEFVLNEEMPKIKIIDFLKGLFNMFKLVVIPQDDGTLYVDTLNTFYASGSLYDVSRYIDSSSYDVDRGVILNEIKFKFKEATTILNMQFEKNTGLGYGDSETFLNDADGEPLDGTSLEFTLPFEQVLYERLIDLDIGFATSVQYAAIVDESIEGVNPAPHLHYVVNNPVGGYTVGFIDDVGAQSEITTYINIPSHTDGIYLPNYSTVFNSEYSTYNGAIINNTLYKNHYETYVLSIFNIKKRTFKYTAWLPLHIITKLQLNDVLKIKNDYYRIDKYSFNLLTGETKLELVNSFENNLHLFSADRENIMTDYAAKTETVTITNLGNSTITLVDDGFGTSWVTTSTSGSVLSLIIAANASVDRSIIVRVSQIVESSSGPASTGVSKTITIIQLEQ